MIDRYDRGNGLVLIITLVIVFGLVSLGYILIDEPIDNTPRVGDIWEHYETGDPFIKNGITVRRIIGVNNGYVQYIEDDRDTISKQIYVFKYDSQKISSNVKKDSI